MNYNQQMKMPAIFAYAVRLASLAYGGFVILASIPLAMLGAAAPSEHMPGPFDLFVLPLAACAIASGFIYVGLMGRHMERSRLHYGIAGLLLAIPILFGTWLATPPQAQEWQTVGLFFLIPGALLFGCAIWPLHLKSSSGAAQGGAEP